jgi:bla regulator protein BlaR1
MILDHELAHIREWDGLAQTFQMILRALYFFHPLVWLINRRLDAYREMACDDDAGMCRTGSFGYARMLASVEKTP